jgi:integrase
VSTLRDAVEEYLSIRRALGSPIPSAAPTLRRFVDFAEREGADFVTTQLALQWVLELTRPAPATRADYLSVVRRFAAWRSSADPRTEVPPRALLPYHHRRKPPHVYSDEEVGRILAAAARIRSLHGLRGPTFSTLFGLLATSGLRISEALALDDPDVDLVDGVLAVRKGKFGKARFVPLHDSTRQALVRYAERRDIVLPGRRVSAFFVTERGKRLRYFTVQRTFARISWKIGLRPRPPRASEGFTGRGPRIHDLRHRFAAARMVQWYREGKDVERELPKLATYLGHSHVYHSYWYIEAVPELLQLATERLIARREEATP